ncbi:MAG: hypothetical protein BZ137_05855 [Methanosphaera sp. rholeuAM130]|nr:MAG: hypothetical protein BZ137_05855 [Methanosphaera sp. rholeuAM130]
MIKYTKYMIIFLALLIAGMSIAVAADVDDTASASSDVSDAVEVDTTSTVDTQAVASVSEDNNQKIIKESKTVKRDENDPVVVTTSTQFDSLFDDVSTSVHQIKSQYSGKTIKINTDLSKNEHSYIINVPITLTSDYNNTIGLNTSNGYENSIIEHWTSLNFTNAASGSNVTNMRFYDTQIFVLNASDIKFDSITVSADQPYGKGTGLFAIREKSVGINVTNSYFNINDNGGISVIALTNAENCLIDHNVITASGSVGNLIYLNTYFYNTNPAPEVTNRNNTISYNTLTGPTTPVNTCFAIAIAGPDNTIEHNNIYYGGVGITTNWQGSYDVIIVELDENDFETVYEGNKYYYNNLYNQASFLCGNYSIVENNYFTGTSNFAGHSNVTSNTFLNSITVKNNVRFHSNTATGQTVTVTKPNSCFKSNTIGTLYFGGAYDTYDCGQNTITSILPTIYEDCFIECSGNCPNCGSTINNPQGNNKNLKGDDGLTIIDIEGGKEYTYTCSINVGTDLRTFILTFNVYDNGTLLLNANSTIWTFLGRFMPIPAVNFNDFHVNITDFVINITERNPSSGGKTDINAKFENDPDYGKINLIIRSNNNLESYWDLEQTQSEIMIYNYKSVTYENMILNTPGIESGITFANNIIVRNSTLNVIAANSSQAVLQMTRLNVRENVTIENSRIEFNLNQSWYSRKGKFYESYGMNISSNVILKNNTITAYSVDKDLSVSEDNYGHAIYLLGDNIKFIDNKVNIRYIRGLNIVGSNNIVENNTITKTGEYTINITGNDNVVRYNTLYSETNEGDDSVVTSGEGNIVENNLPEKLVPTLKVDTTEFTVGSTATISASIYYGDEVLTDINKGKVSFKVNGKTLKDAGGKVIYAKVVNGVAVIEDYEVSQNWAKEGSTIQAVYSGCADLAKMSSDMEDITVTAQEPSITTSDVQATVGQSVTLTATVTATTPVNNGKVVFKINGKTVKDANGKVIYTKVTDGTVNVEYALPNDMKAQEYTLTAVFISNDYGRLEDVKILTVTG